MRDREPGSQSQEPSAKRQRISASPVRGGSLEEMASLHPTIHLNQIERTLQTLLLDVAQYIHEKESPNENRDEINRAETVLRFTGGWVRDKLLGVQSHDIDVGISNMTGYQFGMHLKEYLDIPENLEKYKKDLPKGEMHDAIVSLHKIEANPEKSKHLETVTTKIFGLDIDLVNLRKETYSEDSRNPQMEFGTATEDALRRDATINALFYNLNESKLEDLTERGLVDMEKHIIRTPLEPFQTFKDDPLRVLRLIRFASRLGYQIDPEAEAAMQNEDIRVALKLKISKERVGAELEKMLKGPDPRGALEFIDKLNLFPTIFANHQDEVTADTSNWSLAYTTLGKLLQQGPDYRTLHPLLIDDESDAHHAWMIATFAPWMSIPPRSDTEIKPRPTSTRVVEIARDSLRTDNKTLQVLRDASLHYKDIITQKSNLRDNIILGSRAEIRQQIGLHLRAWGKDWRLCIVMALLHEVMQGRDMSKGRISSNHLFPSILTCLVVAEYNAFMSYIIENSLLNVHSLVPVVNGGEIIQHMGGKKGPWMTKATTMVIEWQLLHPDTDKEATLGELSRRRGELGL
ncbi:TRNA nucleotidyltransferase [Penicillium odoratum]|uniref:TRNA nucleotidyltransferase n=1 Tax=Penicillium odoratum TaxID=1167516 RepID=UPI002547472C|nr:TRNA nucleotidyltransferase [Penicillium odoratum]KAJ5760548.1 TRNA nucleotidyltransferase [Penicillium odoratum]